MTKKYRVIIEQVVIVEVDTTKNRKDEIKFIKEELKNDPPYKETIGCNISYATADTYGKGYGVKIKKVKKICDYKQCSACKGTGERDNGEYGGIYGRENTCGKCGGKGEVIKRRKK